MSMQNNMSAWQWRHNGHDSVSNHQLHHCFLNPFFGRISKKTSKLRVTGLCAGNSPGTGELPAQMASNAENVSIWWRHHGKKFFSIRAKITLKFRVTSLCARNSPVTGENLAQIASNAENVSIWWRHHDVKTLLLISALFHWKILHTILASVTFD